MYSLSCPPPRIGLVFAIMISSMVILVESCSHSPVAMESKDTGGRPALSDFSIVTDRARVILRKGEYDYLEGSIGYTFTNRSGAVVYAPVCRVPDPPYLEKREGSKWGLGYSSVVCLALQEPLAIDPDESVTLTLTIIHGLPGSNIGNRFRVAEIAGTYRMVWNIYGSRDEMGRTWDLIPLELRISNPFVIEVEQDPKGRQRRLR